MALPRNGDGYGSRKFIITSGVILLTAGLAYFEHMNGNTGLVFAAAIASYNYANVRAKESNK